MGNQPPFYDPNNPQNQPPYNDPNNPQNQPNWQQNWQQNQQGWQQQNQQNQQNWQQNDPNWQQQNQQNWQQQPPYGNIPPYGNQPFGGGQMELPNATAILVLGIISIVGCFCYSVPGLICGIIALSMGGKSLRMYDENPGMYTVNSYNNAKAGRICAIIGTILSVLFFLYLIFAFSFGMANFGRHGLYNF